MTCRGASGTWWHLAEWNNIVVAKEACLGSQGRVQRTQWLSKSKKCSKDAVVFREQKMPRESNECHITKMDKRYDAAKEKKISKGKQLLERKYAQKTKVLRGRGNCQEEKIIRECHNYQREKMLEGPKSY